MASYQEWQPGDLITAERLNAWQSNMEHNLIDASDFIRYNHSQALTDEQKTLVQENLGITTMTGATNEDGKAGFVPAPTSAQKDRFLRGDGTWNTPTNTYDRIQYLASATSSSDFSKGKINAKTLAAFNSQNNFVTLSEIDNIDLLKPILFVNTAYSTSQTRTTNYIIYGTGFALTTTFPNFSPDNNPVAIGSVVYLEGTLDHNIFTPTTETYTISREGEEEEKTINKLVINTLPNDDKLYLFIGVISADKKITLQASHPLYKRGTGGRPELFTNTANFLTQEGSLQIGSTILTEQKLQQLLALLN